MRKLTGYIGAMIIVIALMGSILAGYALNINGTSTVINEYEKVTDVSGLYTHTQEPSYIDYNPASNYIGYSTDIIAYTNTPVNPDTAGMGYLTMKRITDNCVINIDNTKTITINDNNLGTFTTGGTYWRDIFYSDNVRVSGTDTNNYYYFTINYNGWSERTINNITLSLNNGTITATGTDTSNNEFNYTFEYTDALIYWTGADFDYYNNRTLGQYTGTIPAYFSDEWPIYTYGATSSNYITSNNNKIHNWSTGTDYNTWLFTYTDASNNNKHSDNINYNGSYHVFYPKNVFKPSLGINYTESNRVNNYLINTDPANIIKTSTKIDLMSISAADQWDTPGNILAATIIANHSTPPYPTWSFFTPNYTNQYGGGEAAVKNDIVIYKLSDILSTYTIPNGTQTVKIDFNSNDTRPYTFYGNTWYLDGNVAFFQKLTEPYNYYENRNIANEKLYGVYDPYTNLVSVYQPNGILEYTETPDNIGVLFVKPNQIYGRFQYHESVNGNYYTEPYTMANRQNPFVTMTSSVYNPANYHYMDITKGISIKSTNVADTNWNNEYSNGKIQILFRAETTPGTYHNTLTIEDNVISVDYNTNKYLVTLNGNDPVDIGTWRNIVLNVDLINGELSAIPVRTFNSYTNVELDNTNIFIGNLVNAAPTNIIKWAPTTNSLTFNVYSTSVFMNTYGAVMVDPTLNITDYFTTLDNFYQLRLSNFSIYGQSMTINGVTGTVTGNTISFNDETIQIKDMAITYADGHAYISDSHATIDLGEITDNNISMSGAWYFITDLMRGYTTEKMIYEWDWQDFILDNVQFCIIYIGLALIGLLIARRYCTLTITDYAIFLVSIVIALTVQVIA